MCLASGVPGSAVLLFELELVDVQKGVPQGFLFIWLQDSPDPLFPAMDMNQDQQVSLEEVNIHIHWLSLTQNTSCSVFSYKPCILIAQDSNKRVKKWFSVFLLLQFVAFIQRQVAEGRGRIRPGTDHDVVIKEMFKNQDRNTDGRITEDELSVTESKHDEL